MVGTRVGEIPTMLVGLGTLPVVFVTVTRS